MDVASALAKLPIVLRQTLNREVTGEKIPAFTIADPLPVITATYEDGEGKVLAACVCDLDFAANSGGALSMIPASAVKESLTAKKLDDLLAENFQEVLNICTSLFANGSQHVKLGRVYFTRREQPDDIKTFVAAPAARKDMKVTISGYGSGRISFLTS